MKDTIIFASALGISEPWFVNKVEFTPEIDGEVLHIYIEHKTGYQYRYDGDFCSIYDHIPRTWRHLNFFQHVCYLHAKVPRVRTKNGSTLQIDVPWADAGSSFTLLFEAYSMLLIKSGMSLTAAGEYMNIDGRILGRIIKRHVANALAEQPLEAVQELGMDETSYQKGHDYITVLTDKKSKKVVGLGHGKGEEAVKEALIEMEVRGADRDDVETISLDFSPSFIAACNNYFPQAAKVFDRFHLDKLLSTAVDQVRREDQKHNVELKKTRYLWLKNFSNLSEKKKKIVETLQQTCPRIGKAYRLKEQFKEIFQEIEKDKALELLEAWITLAITSEIEPIINFTNTLQKHWQGIITYFDGRVSNAFAEQVNLKIQEIKRVAKGYRNLDNFYTMIYFHLGGLQLPLP
jgi:transposase